jgi:hypothetical protein
MPNARTMKRQIPVVNLEPDQEPSAEQIVQVANGELQILNEGEKLGITLPRKDRALFMAAITQGYLKHSKQQTLLAEMFHCWCDAKEIPCVTFEIEKNCVDMLSTNDSTEKDDPFITMHFDAATAARPFTKAGLIAVAELVLEHLSDVALSPWKVSTGVLPFSLARQIMVQVSKIWCTTSERNAESEIPSDQESKPSEPQMIH